MFLDIDSEVLIRGFVDRDLELLANRILEIFYVIRQRGGHQCVIHVNPNVDLSLGRGDLEEQARIVDRAEVTVLD